MGSLEISSRKNTVKYLVGYMKEIEEQNIDIVRRSICCEEQK